MTMFTIEIPETNQKKLVDFVVQLGGRIVKGDSKLAEDTEKLSRKEIGFLKGFDESIEFIKLHQQGKVKAKTIDQLFNEL